MLPRYTLKDNQATSIREMNQLLNLLVSCEGRMIWKDKPLDSIQRRTDNVNECFSGCEE